MPPWSTALVPVITPVLGTALFAWLVMLLRKQFVSRHEWDERNRAMDQKISGLSTEMSTGLSNIQRQLDLLFTADRENDRRVQDQLGHVRERLGEVAGALNNLAKKSE